MGGFITPSLNFASTIGAFVGGAAHQVNQNIEQQRNQDRQDDLLWMNKFERGRLEYEKDKEKTDQKTQAYNAILQAADGNKELADRAFVGISMDPKHYFDAINWVRDTMKANPGYSNPNYQSTMMDTIQSGLTGRHQALQDIYGSVRPEAQKFMSMPPAPGYNSVQPQQQPQPTITAGQPDQIMQDKDLGNTPTPVTNTTTPQPAQVAGSNFNYVPFKAGNTQSLTNKELLELDSFKSAEGYRRYQRSVAQNPTNPALWDYRDLREPVAKAASPTDQANLNIAADDAKKYLHDPKTGMQVRFNELNNLQRQNVDVNEILGMLNNGFKARQPQAAYDELNRFTKGVLGFDLGTLGMDTNTVQDTNLMKKAVANGIINRLSTLHFGRITNYEAGLVQKGFTSSENDPDTNLKIALALKSLNGSSMEQVSSERKAYRGWLTSHPGDMLGAAAAGQQVGEQYAADNYASDKHPWPQFNDVTASTLPNITSLQPGTWFELTSKNGAMVRFLGKTNGAAQFQDSKGNLRTIGQ